jgi:hydrogenase maturation protein HypF
VNGLSARRIIVEGVVQGVGFRPFVHRFAVGHGLAGWVRNIGTGVEALVEGGETPIRAFLASFAANAPPLARITDIRTSAALAQGLRGFAIITSDLGGGTQLLPADVALCKDCRRELYDRSDRRYRHPFITCVNCGPRYSIIEELPYDRVRTTMRAFAMCDECRAEYENPRSRRFHAESIACRQCGPKLSLAERNGCVFEDRALTRARALLSEGKIIALKSLGGYNLACDARNDHTVRRLRKWKARGDKPLAIMVRGETELTKCANVSNAERALLASSAHPIVLVEERHASGLSRQVNPGVKTIGIMLPYTPLHLLLIDDFRDAPAPLALVMTSANRCAEPMIASDDIALGTLFDIADAVLTHDRKIAARIDDGVSHVIDGVQTPLRRARGGAPLPMRLPLSAPPLLACGADMKNAFCLATGNHAVLSAHLGDLENYDVYHEYETTIERLCGLLRIKPEIVCHDLHPQYWSRRFAERRYADTPRTAVQHHHAHVAACMAEHALRGPVIGVAFDGTGYGEDGCLWGGEFLVAEYASFERAAHFAYVPMYGGEQAIREPYRMALAHLHAAGIPWDERFAPVRALDASLRSIASSVPVPLTSSVGRLFDAVAALLDLRQTVTYDAQAAIDLETVAGSTVEAPYHIEIDKDLPLRIPVARIISAVVHDLNCGLATTNIAARFHETMIAIINTVCSVIRRERGVNDVVLTGGVFQNKRLSSGAARALSLAGFTIYRHQAIPANDGGIAYGQAAIVAARLRGNTLVCV